MRSTRIIVFAVTAIVLGVAPAGRRPTRNISS